MEQSIRRNKNVGISFYIQIKTYKSYSSHHRTTATVSLVNYSQLDNLLFLPVIGYFILFVFISLHYLLIGILPIQAQFSVSNKSPSSQLP